MARKNNKSKRSASRTPSGLPHKKNSDGNNPFEIVTSTRRAKHVVHNRMTPANKQPKLAMAIQERQESIKLARKQAIKANSFIDKRLGEYDDNLTREQQTLKRLVKERSRQSKRSSKYSLNDSGSNVLTHRGQAIDLEKAKHHVLLSDDDDDDNDEKYYKKKQDDGALDAIDTAMHFGGPDRGKTSAIDADDYYGNSDKPHNLATAYQSRASQLDELIARRKIIKAEKAQQREAQIDKFEAMDDSFKDLAQMLTFRDKDKEVHDYVMKKRKGDLKPDEQEMEEWDKQTKKFQYSDRKVQATDRTKTPEEIAKEQAEELQELETRRLARMQGDFENDDFSDVDSDSGRPVRKKRKNQCVQNGDELDDLDTNNDDSNKVTTRFTADGLVNVDADGNVIGKVGEATTADQTNTLAVGTRVSALYHAKEQMDEDGDWYNGTVAAAHVNGDMVTYDIDYEDGDYEDGVQAKHVKEVELSSEEKESKQKEQEEQVKLQRKRQLAKEKARTELPYVFEIPTTLETLHDMIALHASTGKDASTMIERIHMANSVRLNHTHTEKMQNYYDVLIRRFMAVGDAIYVSGDGGPELGRYDQLDCILKVLYRMAQDAEESTSAVWSRRLGILQSAHEKRLRDAELGLEEDETAWPSTGVFYALRALGHVFPVTDQRHCIVTPTLLFIGQMLTQTPILTRYDLVIGTMYATLMLEYSREAKRFVPEAVAFLSAALHLYAVKPTDRVGLMPNLSAASEEDFAQELRELVITFDSSSSNATTSLKLEKRFIESDCMPSVLLKSILRVLEATAVNSVDCLAAAEQEVFSHVALSLISLDPKNKASPLSLTMQKNVASTVKAVAALCQTDTKRLPLQRRTGLVKRKEPVKSLAPRMESYDRYSMSKDKGKKAPQAALDRTRREYKREYKAMSRELRMDSAMMEDERRKDQAKKDAKAKSKRNKAFAWLESEQATMNQQVAQGGGLLSGGGTGAARIKARSGKLGIKKGGKLR